MTDEEVQRAMEEGTPVVIRYHQALGVGVVTRRLVRSSALASPDYVGWGVRVRGMERLHQAADLRVATAEELLVEGDE